MNQHDKDTLLYYNIHDNPDKHIDENDNESKSDESTILHTEVDSLEPAEPFGRKEFVIPNKAKAVTSAFFARYAIPVKLKVSSESQRLLLTAVAV